VQSAATSSHAALTGSPRDNASQPKLTAPSAATADHRTTFSIFRIKLSSIQAMKLSMR